MDFPTVLHTRRSVRSFARKDLPGPVLQRILQAAHSAPSACNFQPWRFIVVRDAAAKTRLAALCKGQPSVAGAAVVIVCCGKSTPILTTGWARTSSSSTWPSPSTT